MPNYCYGYLKITGDAKEINAFIKYAKGEKLGNALVLDMNKFIPYPKEYHEMDLKSRKIEEDRAIYLAKYGYVKGKDRDSNYDEVHDMAYKLYPAIKDGYNSGGYDWCISNWGTKWNFVSPDMEYDETKPKQVMYRFETAWSPPIPVIVKMAQKFPNLKFKFNYDEESNGFKGSLKLAKGQIVDEKYKEF